MRTIRFILLGGFLGAGKTTTLARLAAHYTAQGRRVGIVTNDQAQDLVDTNSLRAQGFLVQEVPGACFCCKFDELVTRMADLSADEQPDVILAEPVGSCTDLVATVIQPMKDLYRERFQVAPYLVLFKPSHGLKILREEASGFSPKAAYIFRKQLEEADAVVLNRVDELSGEQIAEVVRLVEREFPGMPVLQLSARTGQGFETVTQWLEQEGSFGGKVLDIDYDIYAEGEAELGWLNLSANIHAEQPFALDELLMDVINGLSERLAQQDGETAHLKVIGLGGATFGVANLVSRSTKAELSLPSNAQVREVDLVVNARVALDPEVLKQETIRRVESACEKRGAKVEFRQTQSLRPGRPTPTHRYSREEVK